MRGSVKLGSDERAPIRAMRRPGPEKSCGAQSPKGRLRCAEEQEEEAFERRIGLNG